jgi:uncharacterized damage-inducible protein DinB
MTTGEVLADQIDWTREWTLKLIADLQGDDWTYQPQPGMQHALWLCGHLACAQELLLFQRCLSQSVLDAGFLTHFPIGGPIKSAGEHDWPDPAVVIQKMEEMQHVTLETVTSLSDGLLAEPAAGQNGAKHPHYDTKFGAISHIVRHEAFHAGQLAVIRRFLGKEFLR